jgi:hypothetical protein
MNPRSSRVAWPPDLVEHADHFPSIQLHRLDHLLDLRLAPFRLGLVPVEPLGQHEILAVHFRLHRQDGRLEVAVQGLAIIEDRNGARIEVQREREGGSDGRVELLRIKWRRIRVDSKK